MKELNDNMPLKLMYITNRPDVALIAEQAGVDRIFIDMEYIGKDERQRGLDSVQNRHTVDDIVNIRKTISKAELLVRVNPIHDASPDYCSSEEEINAVIDAGTDVVMLPYFKTIEEVQRFLTIVDDRVKTLLLLETPEAVEIADDILALSGIDEIHIGLNDLSLAYRKTFMFELLSDGTVERLCLKCKQAGIRYGFGGIASVGTGMLPAEAILKEHYRLGSSMVILSRSFCDAQKVRDLDYIKEKFETGVRSMRSFEKEIAVHSRYFEENEQLVGACVSAIVNKIESNKNHERNS